MLQHHAYWFVAISKQLEASRRNSKNDFLRVSTRGGFQAYFVPVQAFSPRMQGLNAWASGSWLPTARPKTKAKFLTDMEPTRLISADGLLLFFGVGLPNSFAGFLWFEHWSSSTGKQMMKILNITQHMHQLAKIAYKLQQLLHPPILSTPYMIIETIRTKKNRSFYEACPCQTCYIAVPLLHQANLRCALRPCPKSVWRVRIRLCLDIFANIGAKL